MPWFLFPVWIRNGLLPRQKWELGCWEERRNPVWSQGSKWGISVLCPSNPFSMVPASAKFVESPLFIDWELQIHLIHTWNIRFSGKNYAYGNGLWKRSADFNFEFSLISIAHMGLGKYLYIFSLLHIFKKSFYSLEIFNIGRVLDFKKRLLIVNYEWITKFSYKCRCYIFIFRC